MYPNSQVWGSYSILLPSYDWDFMSPTVPEATNLLQGHRCLTSHVAFSTLDLPVKVWICAFREASAGNVVPSRQHPFWHVSMTVGFQDLPTTRLHYITNRFQSCCDSFLQSFVSGETCCDVTNNFIVELATVKRTMYWCLFTWQCMSDCLSEELRISYPPSSG